MNFKRDLPILEFSLPTLEIPELKPIVFPKLEPIDFKLEPFELPKLEPIDFKLEPFELPKLEPLDLPEFELLEIEVTEVPE